MFYGSPSLLLFFFLLISQTFASPLSATATTQIRGRSLLTPGQAQHESPFLVERSLGKQKRGPPKQP
jgi:hypothetical protein